MISCFRAAQDLEKLFRLLSFRFGALRSFTRNGVWCSLWLSLRTTLGVHVVASELSRASAPQCRALRS